MSYNLNDLMTALKEHASFERLFDLCKSLLESKFTVNDIKQCIFSFLHSENVDDDFEDEVSDIVFSLEGRCHPSWSLAPVHA
ncbi:hypothetical protein C942_02537 [Photobacterium marinum]|uniref:Uncharacterized protein n=1 Tax=Photobacterium marinum TaxID=1056511 RepID=L8J6K6_9GAMM|nr:hypothetical protein [Photobacterium marinum]ELR64406.1 hypothetical protein C942_02537 [Photobacterium marinum]